jgi:hypothetical protein
LYPAPLRDFLLHIASLDLFRPKWTATIQDEWIRNLLINRPDLQRKQLQRTASMMNLAFPDANVADFETVNRIVDLPDPNDWHVVAACIKSRTETIVTFNLKDFPRSMLAPLNVEAKLPDVFLEDYFDWQPNKVLTAFHNLVRTLKNPPKSPLEVISTLERCGLKQTSAWLRTMEK